MALWDIKALRTKTATKNYLDDALVGITNLHNGAAVDNLTVIIDAGSGPQTVTFSPVKNRAWTIEEIVTQINAGHASLADIAHIEVLPTYEVHAPVVRRLRILKDSSITVDKDGTANTLLGLPTAADWVRDQILDTEVFKMLRHTAEKDTWFVVTFR
jgi:hypothetical protein